MWLCVVPLAILQWVYEHKKLVRNLFGLVAIAALVAICSGCPVWERPACGSPRAYQCVNNQPHVCSPSQRLTPIGDEPCPGVCVVSSAGVANCAQQVTRE